MVPCCYGLPPVPAATLPALACGCKPLKLPGIGLYELLNVVQKVHLG